MSKCIYIIAATFAGLFLLSLTAVAHGPESETGFKNEMFGDVDFDDPYADAIYYGFNIGFVEGYKTGKENVRDYKSANDINRAEFLKLVLEGTGKASNKAYGKKCFSDVPLDAWFATYICQAEELDLVQGYSDGFFRPEQIINHAEALKILGELSNWELTPAGPKDPWFLPYESYAEDIKLLLDLPLGDFVNRGMVMEMVFRDLLVKDLDVGYYHKKYIDEFMDKGGINYGDAWGPGGVFGPGGPLGGEGINGFFDDDIDVDFLDDEYFDDRYCYFNDSLQEELNLFIESAVNRLAGKDFDFDDLDEYIMDEFGLLECYYEPIADLGDGIELVTTELMDSYDVNCWFDPLLSPSPTNNDLFDTIFCHAQLEEPEWEPHDGDYGNYGDDDGGDGDHYGDNGDGDDYGDGAATISIASYANKTVAPGMERTALLGYDVSAGSKQLIMSEVGLYNFGTGSTNGLKKIYIENDATGEVLFSNDELGTFDWDDGEMVASFDSPVYIEPRMMVSYTVYGDFDWEYDDGNIQLGFVAMQNDVDLVSDTILGASISRGDPENEILGEFSGGLCALLDSENYLPYGSATDGLVPGKKGEAGGNEGPGEVEHPVKPIDQGNENICAAAAVYSSLRWFEEKFGLEDLIENGHDGLDELIGKLYGPDVNSAKKQLDELVDWVNTNHSECLEIKYNTQNDANISCNELKDYYNKGCDIPLTMYCQPLDDEGNDEGDEWGHVVDITGLTVDPNDSNKCTIKYATSWEPDDGSGEDLDGLGGGRYEEGKYNDDEESFKVTSPWGAGYRCRVYSAAYICIDKDKCEEEE